jgi:hypothetical protein
MTKFKADFSETESRGGKKGSRRKYYPAGDYAVKCIKAEITKSNEKETPGVHVVYKITAGKYKNAELHDTLWLTLKSMWRVRQTLEAMGMKVPSKAVNIDTENFQGKTLAVSLDDEEYDGKVYSRVVDSFLLADFDGSDVEDDGEDEVEGEEESEEVADEETETASGLEDLDLDDI